MSSRGTLVPEGPWCVFYATSCQVYWGPAHSAVLCWYSDSISHKNTQTHSTIGTIDWHTHINRCKHHQLCAHSSYVYYCEWIIRCYQKFTFILSLLFENDSLVARSFPVRHLVDSCVGRMFIFLSFNEDAALIRQLGENSSFWQTKSTMLPLKGNNRLNYVCISSKA